ncbi:hypothetical protein L7F22_015802 [Adiantum nelumboides]|nr:hypothetical protein [Adiantum nelumboides]
MEPSIVRARLVSLQAYLSNQTCADCSQADPQWASLSFSIFLCERCAHLHRINQLASLTTVKYALHLHNWSELQVMHMECGSNGIFNHFLATHGIAKETPAARKYASEAALAYRREMQTRLQRRLDSLLHKDRILTESQILYEATKVAREPAGSPKEQDVSLHADPKLSMTSSTVSTKTAPSENNMGKKTLGLLKNVFMSFPPP